MGFHPVATTLLNLQVLLSDFLSKIKSDLSSQARPFIYLNIEKKTYALKVQFQILSMPALSGFTLSLIVDGYHVILMRGFPESLFLVSAECSLHSKTRAQTTNKKTFPQNLTSYISCTRYEEKENNQKKPLTHYVMLYELPEAALI